MNNTIKRTIECALIILIIISAIAFPNIYPITLSIATIVLILLERKDMNTWLLGISCIFWILGTVIYLVRFLK